MGAFQSGYQRYDVALAPSTYSSAEGTQTSSYFELSKYDSVIFVVTAGTMSASGSVNIGLVQAKTCTGSGSVAIPYYSTMNLVATSSGIITRAQEIAIKTSSECVLVTGAKWTINGIAYTAGSSAGYTTGSFDATRTFYGSSSDCEMTMYHLAAYINHPTYGVPGVIAICDSSYVMRLVANASYNTPDVGITLVSSQLSTDHYIKKQVGIIECKNDWLATTSGFNYVGCTILVNGTCPASLGVAAIRSGARYSPVSTNIYSITTS